MITIDGPEESGDFITFTYNDVTIKNSPTMIITIPKFLAYMFSLAINKGKRFVRLNQITRLEASLSILVTVKNLDLEYSNFLSYLNKCRYRKEKHDITYIHD